MQSYCPYCARVKSLFQKLGVQAHIVELDQIPGGYGIQNALAAVTGRCVGWGRKTGPCIDRPVQGR